MAVEPNDVRVLIPRVRRAIDGPTASGSAATSATLDDEQVKALVADAIASVIFYTGGDFNHSLDVVARDEAYNAASEWAINPPLNEAEATVIAAQAALDYFFWSLREVKTQERIADEGQEWSYTLSATLLRDQMEHLRKLRDQALEQLAASNAIPVEGYVSFIAVRDREASALIEPWVSGLPRGGYEEIAR